MGRARKVGQCADHADGGVRVEADGNTAVKIPTSQIPNPNKIPKPKSQHFTGLRTLLALGVGIWDFGIGYFDNIQAGFDQAVL